MAVSVGWNSGGFNTFQAAGSYGRRSAKVLPLLCFKISSSFSKIWLDSPWLECDDCAGLQRTVSFTCHCFAGLQRTVLVFVVVLEEIYPGKLYFQANPQVQTEIQNADSDIYPHIPVGVGTTSKADAPVAIEAASGVAVPPPMRQMRRAMHVDAVAQDSATDMMVPKIPPQHLVVGSRVEGLF